MGSQRIRHNWATFTFTFHIVKTMFFTVVIYECENWTIKKAEWQRIDAFRLWCWRRFLRVFWTTRTSYQSVIGSTDAEAEAPVLCPPDAKDQLTWKDADAGKIEGRKRRERQGMRWLDGITDSMDMGLSKFQVLEDGKGQGSAAVHGVTNSWTWLHDWTTTKGLLVLLSENFPNWGSKVLKCPYKIQEETQEEI